MYPRGESNPGLWGERQISNPTDYEGLIWIMSWKYTITKLLKSNMSHYHLVLYVINSWRRRSKKSKEITLTTKASQMYLIFQILFFKQRNGTMDLKRKKEFNFFYLFILSSESNFEYVIACWITICFFSSECWHFHNFNVLNISQKKK